MPELRPYQKEAATAIRNEFADGIRSTLAVLPTGTGKTQIFCSVAESLYRKTNRPVLMVAHRNELLEQASDRFRSFGLTPAYEQADSYALSKYHEVVVANVASLGREKRLSQYRPDYFGLIITDEAHHSTSPTYRRIFEHFAKTPHLGVTATPTRHDQIGLRNIYESVAFQYSIQDAIADGWLCNIKGQQIEVEDIHLEKLKIVAGDFSREELDKMLREEKALQGMVRPTIEYAKDRPTIVFTTCIEHAHEIAACFNRIRQNSATAVDGSMSAEDRRRSLELFKSGKTQFLVNVGICVEGFDHPPTACIALFRPTKSLTLMSQMVGRGTRLYDGKEDCLVLDFVGVHNTVRVATVNDVLDGTILSDAEHAKAQELQEAGMYATDAVRQAKRFVADEQSIKARFKAFTSSSAFDVASLFALPSCKGKWGGAAITPKQRAFLEGKGVKCPQDMERAEASALIDKLIVRQGEGLATFKQMRMLKRAGYPAERIDRVSFAEASRLIDQYMTKNVPAYATA